VHRGKSFVIGNNRMLHANIRRLRRRNEIIDNKKAALLRLWFVLE
jgi:hypothetical protein